METSQDNSSDRRSKARFPVQLNVRYRTLAGPHVSGTGQTINMSSGGLLIASEHPLVREGTRLQVTLEWPLLLHGMTPLQLIAACQVVRCQDLTFAARLERYQFRTRKSAGAGQRYALARA